MGGVVGGVAALAIALIVLIWFFRKSKARIITSPPGNNRSSFYEKDGNIRVPGLHEADSVGRYELLANKENTPAIELQDTSNRR